MSKNEKRIRISEVKEIHNFKKEIIENYGGRKRKITNTYTVSIVFFEDVDSDVPEYYKNDGFKLYLINNHNSLTGSFDIHNCIHNNFLNYSIIHRGTSEIDYL